MLKNPTLFKNRLILVKFLFPEIVRYGSHDARLLQHSVFIYTVSKKQLSEWFKILLN